MRRHLIVPDAQIKPGVPTNHLSWAAQAAIEYKPDVIVVIGDFWDLPSLSMHDAPGSKEAEGRNVRSDIDAGNDAFRLLSDPILKESQRIASNHRKRWNPELHFITGNHEDRLSRAIARDPKLDGLLTMEHLETPGFERHKYLKILNLDGIKYCHFFPAPHSGRAIGGTIINRLGHIGSSFVQGHLQGFMYASKQYPDHVKHGLVCGRFYQQHETYRAEDVQNSEWNGIVILNGVENGDYDLMPLRMTYLSKKYA